MTSTTSTAPQAWHRRRRTLTAAAAAAAVAALLTPLPAHAAAEASTSQPTSTSSPTNSTSGGGQTAALDPDAPAPRAANAEDQNALERAWQKVKDLITGDDEDDTTSKDAEQAADDVDPGTTQAPTTYVQRTGADLTLDGAPFHFAGADIYWLGLDDNVRDAAGQPTYPSHFRIDDAMRAAQATGGTVVRTWANSVGCARCLQPERGQFNEEAFESLDYAVASAGRHGQRLVISLVDNWDFFHGSKHTYTDWRGLPESAFFSDPQVIADYQAHITHVLDHKNRYTGLRYADDPTIMAWETGNEMWCETCQDNFWDGSWTKAVADHIKAQAPRQLVVDGHGTDPACTTGCLHEASLDLASVDIVDDHHYPPVTARVRSSAETARRHGKAYLVGEYDWRNARGGDDLAAFLDAVRESGAAGALLWSIVPHADDVGFVAHDDGFQYLWPGRNADERARTATLQAFAQQMGAPAPRELPVPRPAKVKAIRTSEGVGVSWRGAAPAVSYTIQRREEGGDFETVAEDVTDTEVSDGKPLWTDTSAEARGGDDLEYRVLGVDAQGTQSKPSAVAKVDGRKTRSKMSAPTSS